MTTTCLERTQHDVRDKYQQLLADYSERLEREREYQKGLIYEASIAESLKDEAEDVDERDEWDMETKILDSLLEMSFQESDRILEDMNKQIKKISSMDKR